ncbi:MAG: ArnT family glycosyltransferase, partial [Terriglobales bacterium]
MPVEAILLLVLVVAAFLVRVWPLSTSHYWDETVYLQNAEVILGARHNYSELASRPPLLSILFAAVFLLWHSIYAAAIVTALLNALGPLFLCLIGRRLFGKPAAAIAALLFAFLPFLVTAGNTLLSDSPALTLVLACFWMLVEGGERDSMKWFVGAGVMGALAVLMRFASLPTIAVLGLLCLRPRRRVAAVLGFGVGFLAAFTPYLAWSRLRYGGFLTTLQHGWANVAGSVDPPSYYLQHIPAIFSWLTVAGVALWVLSPILTRNSPPHATESGLTGVWRWLRSWSLFLCAWIVIVLGYYMAIPHKEERYILPLAPPLLLLAGCGLAQLVILRKLAYRATAIALLFAAFAYTCAPAFARLRDPFISSYVSEEAAASDYLKGIAAPSAALYVNFNYPVFAYYTGLPTHVNLEQGGSFYNS